MFRQFRRPRVTLVPFARCGGYVSFQNELKNVNVSPGPAGYQKELKHPQAPARHFHCPLDTSVFSVDYTL